MANTTAAQEKANDPRNNPPARVGPAPMQLRKTAMDYAVANNAGLDYTPDGRAVVDPDKVIIAATKYAAFLKGDGNDF